MALAREQPLDQASVELDADVADVALADVMCPRMRWREVRQAAGGAKDEALVAQIALDDARERTTEGVAARGRGRGWMYGIYEERNHRRATLANQVEDRLGMRVRQELAVLERARPGDVEALGERSFHQCRCDMRMIS